MVNVSTIIKDIDYINKLFDNFSIQDNKVIKSINLIDLNFFRKNFRKFFKNEIYYFVGRYFTQVIELYFKGLIS